MLQGRKILLGVTGSIAAYKSAYLTRELIKAGAEVKVILTQGGEEFVSPLTFATLSGNSVLTSMVQNEGAGEWSDHVHWGRWADLMLIAPITANSISRLAVGECQDILSAIYLSAECPVHIAPAMDLEMYKHPSTKKNITTLEQEGNIIIQPGTGELASGLHGEGRMAEPEEILRHLERAFAKMEKYRGKRVLITAGPTYEPIDPVRFIGNHSSGRMGFALAEQAWRMGALVELITGPTEQRIERDGVILHRVTTAHEMFMACEKIFPKMDVAVLAAAVADVRPKDISKEKIKKSDGGLTSIELEPTEDILESLGSKKKKDQFLVGFALETENEEANARDKLQRKNCDMIVMNSLGDEGAGFGYETNVVSFFLPDKDPERIPLNTKLDIGEKILLKVSEQWRDNE